jgi:hypothetical protein
MDKRTLDFGVKESLVDKFRSGDIKVLSLNHEFFSLTCMYETKRFGLPL